MENVAAGFGVFSSVAFVLFLVLLAILWIALPFAIFGMKDILRQLVREQKRTNELLEAEHKLKSDLANLRRTSREA